MQISSNVRSKTLRHMLNAGAQQLRLRHAFGVTMSLNSPRIHRVRHTTRGPSNKQPMFVMNYVDQQPAIMNSFGGLTWFSAAREKKSRRKNVSMVLRTTKTTSGISALITTVCTIRVSVFKKIQIGRRESLAIKRTRANTISTPASPIMPSSVNYCSFCCNSGLI